MPNLFVRLGSLAEVHTAAADHVLPRARRVIVRTARGLELGEVIGPSDARADSRSPQPPLSRVVRATTEEDEILIRRLDRHKRKAVEACRTALTKAGSSATLLDVDQLFDGGTLIMHFLGEVDEVAESITSEVVQQYESVVRARHIAKLLMEGCGPDCGTQDGGGCGTSCAGCAVAGSCAK